MGVAALIDWFIPKLCLGCGWEGAWLCRRCLEQLPTGLASGCPDCSPTWQGEYCVRHRYAHSLDGLKAVGDYSDPLLREAIHCFKYGGVKELIGPLGDLLLGVTGEGFSGASRLLELNNPALVPIPLHPVKLRQRGFNQAELLAERVAKQWQWSLRTDWLVKLEQGRPQAELSRLARQANAREMYGVPLAMRSAIEGQSILLVDDVATTGSTLESAAKVLRLAGAITVRGLVLARG